jgi:NAD-dependent SIR2 family protein deacetylase
MSEHFDAIKLLIKQKKLIPFVGAGLSMNLGLPSFSQLIDKIAEELGYDPAVFKLNGNNLQLAEYYVAVKGAIGPLRSILDRSFDPTDEQIKTSVSHTALVQMNLPVIYTTNYDNIIEKSFELLNKPVCTIANIDDISSAPENATQIVKFHGTFSDDESLVLTESNYFERLSFESAMDIKLRADMLGKCLLFIGYSLDDVNVRYMLYKLFKLRQQVKKSRTRNLPSAYLTTFGSGEIQKTLLAQWNVTIIELDPLNKQVSIENFLKEFI